MAFVAAGLRVKPMRVPLSWVVLVGAMRPRAVVVGSLVCSGLWPVSAVVLLVLERVYVVLQHIQDRGEMLPIFFPRRGRAKTSLAES